MRSSDGRDCRSATAAERLQHGAGDRLLQHGQQSSRPHDCQGALETGPLPHPPKYATE